MFIWEKAGKRPRNPRGLEAQKGPGWEEAQKPTKGPEEARGLGKSLEKAPAQKRLGRGPEA